MSGSKYLDFPSVLPDTRRHRSMGWVAGKRGLVIGMVFAMLLDESKKFLIVILPSPMD